LVEEVLPLPPVAAPLYGGSVVVERSGAWKSRCKEVNGTHGTARTPTFGQEVVDVDDVDVDVVDDDDDVVVVVVVLRHPHLVPLLLPTLSLTPPPTFVREDDEELA
jgi:hypothetical protein